MLNLVFSVSGDQSPTETKLFLEAWLVTSTAVLRDEGTRPMHLLVFHVRMPSLEVKRISTL